MSKFNKNYENLRKISRHIRILEGVLELLEWDQRTYMPSKAAEIRGEQIETLAGIIHKEKTGKKFERALGKLIDIKAGQIIAEDLGQQQKIALKEWRYDFQKNTALPQKIVQDIAREGSIAKEVWRESKKNNDFNTFAPYLDKLIILTRRAADYLGYQDHPYDALLEMYEANATYKKIKLLFDDIKNPIINLLNGIKSSKQVDDSFLQGEFKTEEQIKFVHKLLEGMGFDASKGRLDLSTHPFSIGVHPTDSRITMRSHANTFFNNLLLTLHEAGHSLYEMGLPQEEYGTPLGQPISFGIHESQSRLWETRIGRSKPYWQYYLPILKKYFAGRFDAISINAFYQAINKVNPSLIRLEADEVTYSLHIILRFEIEYELIGGSLKTKDIPELWNSKMKQFLGIEPQTYAQGCMQDIHWSKGAFGYFPSYAVGNLYASHLFMGLEKEFPDWEIRVSKGELLFIKEWLHQNVHQYGRQYSGEELLKKVTGKPFSASAYIKYLQKKYNEIYNLKNV